MIPKKTLWVLGWFLKKEWALGWFLKKPVGFGVFRPSGNEDSLTPVNEGVINGFGGVLMVVCPPQKTPEFWVLLNEPSALTKKPRRSCWTPTPLHPRCSATPQPPQKNPPKFPVFYPQNPSSPQNTPFLCVSLTGFPKTYQFHPGNPSTEAHFLLPQSLRSFFTQQLLPEVNPVSPRPSPRVTVTPLLVVTPFTFPFLFVPAASPLPKNTRRAVAAGRWWPRSAPSKVPPGAAVVAAAVVPQNFSVPPKKI